MKCAQLEKLMIHIARQYYEEGKYEDFFAIFHPEVVILSVGKGQMVAGKENAMKAFSQRISTGVMYDIVQINSKVIPQGTSGKDCLGVLIMDIVAHFPDGRVHKVNQRVTSNWHYCIQSPQSKYQIKTGWYVMNGHASVALETEKKPETMLHASSNFVNENIPGEVKERRYQFRDTMNSIHFIREPQIVYIEAMGKWSVIHLNDGNKIETMELISDVKENLGEAFYQIHRSYIVNRNHVQSVKNKSVIMKNDVVLPVPEKKYGIVKQELSKIRD